jgi:uncharacterized membrane protein YtjA (UPF0391 family)
MFLGIVAGNAAAGGTVPSNGPSTAEPNCGGLGCLAEGGRSPRYFRSASCSVGPSRFLSWRWFAAIFGFGGIAAVAVDIARIIFVVAIILFVISAVVMLIRGRSPTLP